MLNDPLQVSVDKVDWTGLAIRRPDGRHFHVGLLYRAGKKVRIRHQCGHLDLKDEEASHPDDLWANITALSPLNKRLIANKLLRAGGDKVPYGIGYRTEGGYIDKKTMKYLLTDPGQGLTCSTYIIAILETLGFAPFDRATWKPTDEDTAWQTKMLDFQAASHRDAKDHFEAEKVHIGEPRYRPDQVMATAFPEKWPVPHDTANEIAVEVVVSYEKMRPNQLRPPPPTPPPATSAVPRPGAR
jgi:hypothetical protein